MKRNRKRQVHPGRAACCTGSGALGRLAVSKLVFVVFWLATPVSAQEDTSRHIDPTAFVTVRIDLEQFDLRQMLELLQKYEPERLPDDAVLSMSGMATPIIDSLKSKAGATEVVASLSTLDILTGSPSLLISVSKPDAAAEAIGMVLGWVPPALGYAQHPVPGKVVVCTEPAWHRIEAATAPRQEIANALKEAESAPLSITLAFADHLAQSVASLWPDALPEDLPIELSPKAMMRHVKSVTLKAWTAPEPRLELVLACRTEEGTGVARGEVDSLFKQLSINVDQHDAGPNRVAYAATGAKLDTLLRDLSGKLSGSAQSQQAANDMKRLSIAFHNFEAKYGGFVPRMTVSPDGKPLLSWRVHLLPFFGYSDLYEQFHLDEPWDSPHNIELVEQIPLTYQSANPPGIELGRTCIQVPMMKDSYWNGRSEEWQTFRALTDSTDTICFVAAPKRKSVIWTKPDDLLVDAENPVRSLFGDRDNVLIARFNSSVITLPASITPDSLRAQLTHASGD
jgi:hypothetical protein